MTFEKKSVSIDHIAAALSALRQLQKKHPLRQKPSTPKKTYETFLKFINPFPLPTKIFNLSPSKIVPNLHSENRPHN